MRIWIVSAAFVFGVLVSTARAQTSPAAPGAAQPVVSRVEVSGNTLVPEADIRSEITLKAGEAYRPEDFQADADAIEGLYSKRGFQAVIEPDVMSPDGVVRFHIQESVVDGLEVRGNRKTRRDTVLRMSQTRPGLLYRRDQVLQGVRDMYNLGIFNDVTYRLEPGAQPGNVKVVYTVEEAKTGAVSAGFSYSGYSGLIGQVEVSERNFGGRADGASAFVQSGGKYYRSGFQIQYHHPYLDRVHSAVDIGAYAKTVYRFNGNDYYTTDEDESLGYDEFRNGGDFSYSRLVSPNLTAALGFRANGVNARYAYVVPEMGSAEGRNPGIQDGAVYVASTALAYDRRDYGPDPGRGDIKVVALEAGGTRTDRQTFLTGSVGGEPVTATEPGQSGSIARVSMDWRHYSSHGRTEKQPTRPVPVLATRIVAGRVSGDVPYWEQFFVGGVGLGGVHYARFLSAENAYEDPFVTSSQALRGYPEGRFWGRNMLVGSVEYRIPVSEATRLAVFADAGDAWDNAVKVLDPYEIDPKEQDGTFKAHVSAGFGLRVATPMGPLRVDIGFGSEGSRTHFSIGQVF